MIIRTLLRVAACIALAAFLSACFVSNALFERERIWDPAWFGRYEATGVTFVVLPDDPARRTYLVGEFSDGANTLDAYRVALYPGWDQTLILGRVMLGKNETVAAYILLKPLAANRFVTEWPDCSATFAQAHNLPRDQDVCRFDSLDALRTALKAYSAENVKASGDQPAPLDRRRDHPLSTIGIVAQPGVFNDSEGVHGGLRLIDVPAGSPAARAGLKKGDLIFGVGPVRPAFGEELSLRIAAAAPGTSLSLAFFDGARAKRQVNVTTAPLE